MNYQKKKYNQYGFSENETPVIEVTNGTFKWDETIEMPTLSNIKGI